MRLLFITLAAIVFMVSAAHAESCVTNASDHSYFFAVTPKTGTRVTQELEPNTSLCSPTGAGAIVSVYEAKDAFEGCSRIVSPDNSDSLITYAEFDRCEWESHAR